MNHISNDCSVVHPQADVDVLSALCEDPCCKGSSHQLHLMCWVLSPSDHNPLVLLVPNAAPQPSSEASDLIVMSGVGARMGFLFQNWS